MTTTTTEFVLAVRAQARAANPDSNQSVPLEPSRLEAVRVQWGRAVANQVEFPHWLTANERNRTEDQTLRSALIGLMMVWDERLDVEDAIYYSDQRIQRHGGEASKPPPPGWVSNPALPLVGGRQGTRRGALLPSHTGRDIAFPSRKDRLL